MNKQKSMTIVTIVLSLSLSALFVSPSLVAAEDNNRNENDFKELEDEKRENNRSIGKTH